MKNTLIACLLFGTFAAAVQYGNPFLMGAVVIVVAFRLMSRRVAKASGYATVRGHSHEGPIARVARHEGGHAAAARLVGGRVLDARVTGNANSASGYTDVVIPNDPASRVGVYLAGFAAAPGTSSPTDQPLVDQVLASVPAPFRGAILSEGQKIARRAAGSSDVGYYARKLEKDGRI